MKPNRAVEFATGLFIFLGLVALFFLITQTTNIAVYSDTGGYTVSARFTNIGGLKVRAPVTMAGVTIGRVTDIKLDATRLDAVVSMEINGAYEIPADSNASILTAGLLGEKYIGLVPGAAPEPLQEGDEILFTQSAIVLENLISKYLFNTASGTDSQGE